MTVILVHSTSEYSFLAADSRRTKIGPNSEYYTVEKVHVANDRSVFVMGGQMIDRTFLANRMVYLRREGVEYVMSAHLEAPELFAKTRHDMEKSGIVAEQFVVFWTAETENDQCVTTYHRLPESHQKQISGLDLMGPDSQELWPIAVGKAKELAEPTGGLALDLWAYEVMRASTDKWSSVGFPVHMVMLRRDGSCHRRTIPLNEKPNRDPDFSGCMEGMVIPTRF